MNALFCEVTVPTEKEEYRLNSFFYNCSGEAYSENSLKPNASKKETDGRYHNTKTMDTQRNRMNASGGMHNVNKGYCNEAPSCQTADSTIDLDLLDAQNKSSRKRKSTWHSVLNFIGFGKPKSPRKRSIPLPISETSSLECVLRTIIKQLDVPYVFWSKDLDERMLQARFNMLIDERYECLIATLNEWGIGERYGTSVTVINCLEMQSFAYPSAAERNKIRNPWENFMGSVRCRVNVTQVVRDVSQDGIVNFDFIVLLISASVLACFGLADNNHIFLSSSMLISPLMGPIIAAIFGVVIRDNRLFILGLRNEFFGLGLATIVGFIFGTFICFWGHFFAISEGLTHEILSRCELSSLSIGFFTALASGAAGAIGVLGGNVGSLVGVAISASLLPPAINSGLLWALALGSPLFSNENKMLQNLVRKPAFSTYIRTELIVSATISMSLTLINIICVWIMGVIVLRVKEVAPYVTNNTKFWKHDIKIARKTGVDAETAEAIDNVQPQTSDSKDLKIPRNQHTWSPNTKNDEFDFVRTHRNYHTVHNVENMQAEINLKKNNEQFKQKSDQTEKVLTVMELFALGPIVRSKTIIPANLNNAEPQMIKTTKMNPINNSPSSVNALHLTSTLTPLVSKSSSISIPIESSTSRKLTQSIRENASTTTLVPFTVNVPNTSTLSNNSYDPYAAVGTSKLVLNESGTSKKYAKPAQLFKSDTTKVPNTGKSMTPEELKTNASMTSDKLTKYDKSMKSKLPKPCLPPSGGQMLQKPLPLSPTMAIPSDQLRIAQSRESSNTNNTNLNSSVSVVNECERSVKKINRFTVYPTSEEGQYIPSQQKPKHTGQLSISKEDDICTPSVKAHPECSEMSLPENNQFTLTEPNQPASHT